MHICMLSTGFDPILPNRIGAIEPYVYNLSKELAKSNKVSVFGYGHGEITSGNLKIKGFTYNQPVTNVFSNLLGRELGNALQLNFYVLNHTSKSSINIFHIHTVYSGLIAYLNKFVYSIPTICSIHNEIRSIIPIKSCNKVLAVSNYIKDFLNKKGLKKEKITVVPIGIDTEIFKPFDQKMARAFLCLPDSKLLLFAGRKCFQKGPQVLIRALPSILKEEPDVNAILVGPDYYFGSADLSYTKQLISIAKKYDVLKRLIFINYVPPSLLRYYYAAADLCIFPSIAAESFGAFAAEAGACQKPVIASRVGGIPEVVIDDVSGILIEPNNQQQIACAIKYLLNNSKIANNMGKNGLKLIQKNFSYPEIAKKCNAIYEELL